MLEYRWTLQLNDTLVRVKEMVETAQAPVNYDASQFEAAKKTILEKLAALPGPNAHVDAHGAGHGEPVIFVGEGDPHATFPASRGETASADQDLDDPRLRESAEASDEAAAESQVA